MFFVPRTVELMINFCHKMCSETLRLESPRRIEMVPRVTCLLPRRGRCTWRAHRSIRSRRATAVTAGERASTACEQSTVPWCRDEVPEECTLCVDSDACADPRGMAASHASTIASLHAATAASLCWSKPAATSSATSTSSTNGEALYLIRWQQQYQ